MRAILTALILSIPAVAWAQAPESQPAAPAAPAAPSEQALLDTADEISGKVGKIRGLDVKRPVKKGIKKREELRSVLVSKLAEEVNDDDIEAEAAVFKRLGVIPADLDYKAVLLDVLTEQIAGFYDQSTEELYIMQGIPLDMQRPAMAHELFHAIQDQHFDIESMQEPFGTMENSDFALARSALIEGDATVVMFDFEMYENGQLPQGAATSLVDIPMMANVLTRLTFDSLTAMESLAGSFGGAGMGASDTALAKAPAIFRESLVFPYFAGMRFIVRSRIQRSWADVDEIYKNPPVSTEQILHPERYFAGDYPDWLDYDPSGGLPGYEQIYDSVLGEFQMGQFFKAHPVEGLTPADAVTGWDGDRVFAYKSADGEVALVHLTAWDSVEEAKEYYTALQRVSAKRYPNVEPKLAEGKYGQSSCSRLPDSERLYIEQWGDLVLYIEGAPSTVDASGAETNAATYKVRDAVWKSFERRPFMDEMNERLAEKKSAATSAD